MTDTIKIDRYTADGWCSGAEHVDLLRVAHYAASHGLLPIESEQEAIRATEAAYGWGGPGPRIGQITVTEIPNWRWLSGWET